MLNMIKLMLEASSLKESNMELKVIKSEEQYQEYLNWVDELFDRQFSPETREGEMLQVALLLIKQYEDANCLVCTSTVVASPMTQKKVDPGGPELSFNSTR